MRPLLGAFPLQLPRPVYNPKPVLNLVSFPKRGPSMTKCVKLLRAKQSKAWTTLSLTVHALLCS